MVRVGQQFEIAVGVVQPVAVSVVNDFVVSKVPADALLDNQPMLSHVAEIVRVRMLGSIDVAIAIRDERRALSS